MMASFPTIFTILLCILSSGAFAQKSALLETNQWRLSNLIIERPPLQDRTPDVLFSLYRTQGERCTLNKTSTVPSKRCTWEISPNPVSCIYGIIGPASRFRTPTGEWKECQQYTLNPDGEEEIPQELRKWIKWRTAGLEEHPYPTNASLIDFDKVKIEVVQGVPMKR